MTWARVVAPLAWLMICASLACDATSPAGPPPQDAAAAETPGDDREGRVRCGADTCRVDEDETVCCYEPPFPDGVCVSPRHACGPDDQGFACDGPEDCGASESCCLIEGDRVGWCTASCSDDSVCHTQRDCLGHERCEPMAHGYARCTSDDDRATIGHDDEGRVFCGDGVVCEPGERCCMEAAAGAPTCRAAACAEGEVAVDCDGTEDCAASEICHLADGGTRCVSGEAYTGEPEFVCHTQSECYGYHCVAREDAATLGFCDPNTGT